MQQGKPSKAEQDVADLLAGKLGRIVISYMVGMRATALTELAQLPEQQALPAMTALRVMADVAEAAYLKSKGYRLPIIGRAQPIQEH